MNFLADPGGRFSSDTHRRVLAHLSYPDDNYAWSAMTLIGRMLPDAATQITSEADMVQVLQDLVKDGHAQKLTAPNGQGVWKMTQSGFDTLTGGIANEPPPGAAVQGPALIGPGGATSLQATSITPAQPTEDVAAVPDTQPGGSQ